MPSLLEQIKARRLALGLRQSDMQERTAMLRQQYQRLESQGNPRLSSLEQVATGLNADLMLIPREKKYAVLALLQDDGSPEKQPYEDIWQDILGDLDDDD